jgi:guanosine-3',5'-bis(diphosphate) 3'-pyrophosphohydrolase
MEDTEAGYIEIKTVFGERVAEGVLALTKFSNLEKSQQLVNSLDRIKMLEKEVWAIKLADRITNLQAPPLDWEQEKRQRYLDGSINILNELGPGNEYLARRLQEEVQRYTTYVITGEKEIPNGPYTP